MARGLRYLVALLLWSTLCAADQTAWFPLDRYRLVVTPVGYRSRHAVGAFSSSYLHWGTIRSEGRQIQHGRLLPALAVVDGRLVVPQDKQLYRRSEFWLAAGPVLVRSGKPVPFREWRREFPRLDTRRRTHRVAVCIRDNAARFVYVWGSLHDLQRRCMQSGAEWALNLDGGSCAVFRYGHRRLRAPGAQYQVLVVSRRPVPE